VDINVGQRDNNLGTTVIKWKKQTVETHAKSKIRKNSILALQNFDLSMFEQFFHLYDDFLLFASYFHSECCHI
jgi:hypothetical protein